MTSEATRVDVRLRDAAESASLPKELMVVGPAGTGKTYAILTFLHMIAADYPNLRILIVRQTRASLTESVLVTYEQEILPADGMEEIAAGASRRNRASYLYPNGTEVVLGGLDNPTRIASTAWDVAFLNEAIEADEDGWETIASRLDRPGRDPRFGWLLGDTNPGDPAHWLKRRIDEGRTPAWDTLHRANPALHDGRDWTAAGSAYMARLDRLRGTRRKRLLEGVWAAGEGQWFETFGDGHVSPSAAYDPAYPVHLAVDSGVHTGAVWFQVKGQGDGATVNVFGDLYLAGGPAFDVGKAVLEKTAALGLAGPDGRPRFDYGTTDPAGNSQSAVVSVTVIGEYRRAGLNLRPWPSYPGSVADGLALIESFVAIDPPQLVVHPRCTRLIEAFANYKRKKRAGQWIDRPEDPQHPYEDLMDALRGGLMARFPKGRGHRPGVSRAAGPGFSELTPGYS